MGPGKHRKMRNLKAGLKGAKQKTSPTRRNRPKFILFLLRSSVFELVGYYPYGPRRAGCEPIAG